VLGGSEDDVYTYCSNIEIEEFIDTQNTEAEVVRNTIKKLTKKEELQQQKDKATAWALD
jgi:hypothetical protein